MPASSAQPATTKSASAATKIGAKSNGKEMPISPGAPAAAPAPSADRAELLGSLGARAELLGSLGDRAELLGSLTTQQQQRTSARVIKKLRLDDAAADRDKKVSETQESDTSKPKEEAADLAKLPPGVKPRMPKAIWLTEEKNLFFEALNEYGKDFDAITSHICVKMKKKGVPDAMIKTKNQVSHFYYRTWHKLSKHVHFDENVKKVAQELYALINYGELRKKLVSVNERTCARLGELVWGGSLAVRARGRALRVRTPVCRALRTLNHLAERALCGRVSHRATLVLRARDAAGWARVQAAAHNPRAALALPLRAPLKQALAALEARWRGQNTSHRKRDKRNGTEDNQPEAEENGAEGVKDDAKDEDRLDLESHLNLEPERTIVQEQRVPRRLALHVGPLPKAPVHLPTLAAGEHLSSQKICFASYLERMGRDRDMPSKIRTPKRQRKDSASEKDKEVEQKKLKTEEEPRLVHIDERAIDGIELMASFKQRDHLEKPAGTIECDGDVKMEISIEEHDLEEREGLCREAASEKEKDTSEKEKETLEKEKDASEKEKDSFSEMEDEDKFNNCDTEDKFNNCDTDNESDGRVDKTKDTKFKNLKVKFRIRPKKRGGAVYTLITDSAKEGAAEEPQRATDEPQRATEETIKAPEEPQKVLDEPPKAEPDIDVEFVTRQIRKGWSVYDAGELTIGDLYLMFGSRSRIELDYWWAEPTPPLPQPHKHTKTTESPPSDKTATERKDKIEKLAAEKREKLDKTPEKGTDSSVEEDAGKRESDTDLFSPKNTFNQDSNDGLSGDERRNEQHLPSEPKCGSLSLASKLMNRPTAPAHSPHLAVMADKLKRLLAMAGNPHALAGTGLAAAGKCVCAHLCAHHKRKNNEKPAAAPPAVEPPTQVFRHPTPIAPKPDTEIQQQMSTQDLPRWRRGRPKASDRRVVVQRLLPLLPKLPPADNLIPVKMMSNSQPQLPKLLPKPAQSLPMSTDTTQVYVVSESRGQFYFHDGDRKVPLGPAASLRHHDDKDAFVKMELKSESSSTLDGSTSNAATTEPTQPVKPVQKTEDIASFLPSESMSLSPSRLLRDGDGAWLDGAVQDFSLSSFLGHLEGRPHPDLAVDLGVQSLMAESSVDYVAKFADLAAEVTDDHDGLA